MGNIHSDPLFAKRGVWVNRDNSNETVDPQHILAKWTEGDYHLKSQAGRWDSVAEVWAVDAASSPCIDAGAPGDPVGYEPSPNGSRVNMGVYGGTNEASKSPSL